MTCDEGGVSICVENATLLAPGTPIGRAVANRSGVQNASVTAGLVLTRVGGSFGLAVAAVDSSSPDDKMMTNKVICFIELPSIFGRALANLCQLISSPIQITIYKGILDCTNYMSALVAHVK